MGESTQETRTFKCKCGVFQVNLTGDSVLDSNCHCHSCVSCCRFVEKSYPGGTTGIEDHGAALSLFKSSQVEFQSDELPADKFGCVKVGPKGKLIRLYTKCCGTMIGFALSKFMALNRNAIYNSDGSRFEPAIPPHNLHRKNAFDPSLVPEPSYDAIPFKLMLLKVFPILINPFGRKINDKALFPQLDDAEVVDITWE